MSRKLENYLNEEGKVTSYPTGKEIRLQILYRLVEQMQPEQRYTEQEINQMIQSQIAFSDYEMLRRELFQYKIIGRLRDGSAYWLESTKPMDSIEHKLILVEGLPGCGKTTMTQKIEGWLKEQGKTVCYYPEGCKHPTDMAWSACLDARELSQVYEKYPKYQEAMEAAKEKVKVAGQEYWIVPYASLSIMGKDSELMEWMSNHEVYDGRRTEAFYQEIHRRRWERFGNRAQTKEEIHLFECAFLQNPLNELLLFECKKEADLERYLRSLLKQVRQLHPVMFYIQTDHVEETLQKVAGERLDQNGTRIWEKMVAEYIQNSPLGRKLGYQGVSGMHRYYQYCKEIELRLLDRLKDRLEIIMVDNTDHAQAEALIQKSLRS